MPGATPSWRWFAKARMGTDDPCASPLSSGDLPADTINARPLNHGEIDVRRSVSSVLGGFGMEKEQKQRYVISDPDEPGDGTVPHRSGVVPRQHQNVKALMQVEVGHEPAFKDSELARRFTLRAIVQIAQDIQKTSLHYG
jgi:hypothetical protein